MFRLDGPPCQRLERANFGFGIRLSPIEQGAFECVCEVIERAAVVDPVRTLGLVIKNDCPRVVSYISGSAVLRIIAVNTHELFTKIVVQGA